MKKMEFHPYQIKVINVPPVIGEKLELMTKRHSGNNISGEIYFFGHCQQAKETESVLNDGEFVQQQPSKFTQLTPL
jgi:hypothetical protein